MIETPKQNLQPLNVSRLRVWVQKFLEFLGAPQKFTLAVIAYLLLMMALRLFFFPGASEDDAETLLLAQSLEGGYKTGQPPLYIWISYIFFSLFGPTLPVVVGLKFISLATLYILIFHLARLFTQNNAWSVIAGISVLGIYYISWDAILNYSQTALLAALSVALIHALVRLAISPSSGWFSYIWLGIVIGAGIMTKYNFIILVIASLFAASMDLGLRKKLLRRGFLSALISVIIMLPHAYWLLNNHTSSGLLVEPFPVSGNAVMLWLAGIAGVLEATVSVLLPLLAMIVIFFPRSVWNSGPIEDIYDRWKRFCERGFWALLILMVAAVLISGTTEIRNHWLIILAPFPAYAALRIFISYNKAGVASPRLTGFVCFLLTLGIVAGIGVSVRATVMSASCGKCKMVVPYSQLANGLKGAGFDNGTIYVHDYPTQVGGNLRPFFPNSRVASFKYNIYLPPLRTDKTGKCLAVWLLNAGEQSPSREMIRQRLVHLFNVLPSAHEQIQVFDVKLPGRKEPLQYESILIDDRDRQGTCR